MSNNKKLNIHVKLIGLFDLLKFKGLVKARQKMIENGPTTPLVAALNPNILAKQLHPHLQLMKISKVIEYSNDVKSYILVPNDQNGRCALHRAGQYLSVKLKIGNSLVSRPYSICSVPNEECYEIAVKRSVFVSGYILDNWKVDDVVEVSSPEGNFYFEGLRDEENIIGLAGGCGITPFLSMARAIASGIEDFNLTILYGCRKASDALFSSEFKELETKCNGKLKVVYVMSDEAVEGCESGFITKELIEKYTPKKCKYSIFICGPQAMYKFCEKEFIKLKLDKRHVREELFGEVKDVASLDEFPKEFVGKQFTLTVIAFNETYKIPCNSEESLLVAIERAGLNIQSKCRSGECGWCRSRLVSGNIFVPVSADHVRIADRKYGFIHPCSSYPLSDITLDVPLE